MKFVADGMLGKSARWLRLLGHDVEYSGRYNDEKLLRIAKAENRTLLTRDFELYRQAVERGIEAFYVEGRTEAEKLAFLAKRYSFRLNVNMATSRCPKCNTTVQSITKTQVAGKVEKSTFKFYDDFWQCPNCRQIYWQGAHWTKIESMLKESNQILARLDSQSHSDGPRN